MSGPLRVGSERSHKEKVEVPGSPEKAWGAWGRGSSGLFLEVPSSCGGASRVW